MNKIQYCSVYKDQTDKQIIVRLNEIQRLLNRFRVETYAYDPGVKGYILGIAGVSGDLNFGSNEWKWLEPLLRELLKWREYGEKFHMTMNTKGRRKHEISSKK